MQRKTLLMLSVSAVLASILAACGSGGSGNTSSTTTSSGKFSTPLKIVGVFDVAGEDPVSTNENLDAVNLAITTLNAAGGVGGHPVQFTRIPETYSPSTAQTAFLQALAAKPSAIIGFDVSTILDPLERQIATSGVPFIAEQTDSVALASLTFPNDLFSFRAPTQYGSAAVTKYLINKYHPKSVGLICVSDPYGANGCNADAAVINAQKLHIVNRVDSGLTSTNETTQASAMRGADIVLDEGFPGPITLDIRAMEAAGMNIPVSAGASAAYTAPGLTAAQRPLLYGSADCVPPDFTAPASSVEAKFVAKFGQPMQGFVAEYYDGIMMIAKAAELAHSSDPKEIADELRTMTYQGICSTYKAAKDQMMNSFVDVVSFAPSGNTIVEEKAQLDLGH